MPCLLVILALALPRVVMVFIYLLTDWFSRAYDGWALPILGFIFLPYTTLAYMAAQLHGGLHGWWIVLLVIAVLADLKGHGSTRTQVRTRGRGGMKFVTSRKVD